MRDEAADHQGHSRWVLRPMKERCETHEFFEVGKVYRHKGSPQQLDELKAQFWCEASFVHKATRVLYAVGEYRSDGRRPWNPYPVQFVYSNWAEGWDEIEPPEADDAG